MIKSLHLENVLSFRDCEVGLGKLNVLIGPNAVGKSNLVEVIALLQSTPFSIAAAVLRRGGVRQWIWLGDPVASPLAKITVVASIIDLPEPVRYELEFSESNSGFVIISETIAGGHGGGDYLNRTAGSATVRLDESWQKASLNLNESALSQFKNPLDRTPITKLGNLFSQTRIFREFRTGPQSGARTGISTSVAKDALTDGSDNLALVLHELDFLGVHDKIRDYFRRFCERFEDVKVSVGDGLARTYLREAGLVEMLSAIRMSDGTLKFLSLLAALFHPKRPPTMCIEEPETGLHPDAMQLVAEALIEASEHMQLIVTTHSESLIDALSDIPDCVLVCERDFDGGTQMRRLSKKHLSEWLEHYSLGQLWRKGEIGGGRW